MESKAATPPLPGAPVRGSTTARPIMALFDLLGRRMAQRILWELRDGPRTFRGLIEAAGTNPAVLNSRLAELRAAGLVTHTGAGYGLTPDGMSLGSVLRPIVAWSEDWSVRLAEGTRPA